MAEMTPKTIVITDPAALEGLIAAVETHIDYINDTMLENSPLFSREFKKVRDTCQQDYELEDCLKDIRDQFSTSLERIIALKVLLTQLKDL